MSYRIRNDYQASEDAAWYDAQYRLSPRAKLANWGERRAFRRMLARAPQQQQRVLDIACGTGRFLEELTMAGHRATGLDASPEMLAIARRNLDGSPLLESLQFGDAEHLPFETGSFDGITCMRLYHKVPPLARAQMLKEVRRVGRGWAILFFAISTPWLDLRRSLVAKARGRPVDRFALTHAELRRELQAADLRLSGRAWVLPGVFEGLVTLVTW
jgi:ubiquinone/menaquinone biosynthesis C-methylase UbiE